MLNAYKLLLKFQFGGAVVLLVILGICLLFAPMIYKLWQPSPVWVIVLAGMLGAFFSALTRLYNVSEALISPTMQMLEARYLFMYSSVPPVIGAVAAMVLYFAFVGNFFGSGGFFPAFGCGTENGCVRLHEILQDFGPKTAPDYGKTLIWSFVAGFSERFVPDTLQTFVARSQEGGK